MDQNTCFYSFTLCSIFPPLPLPQPLEGPLSTFWGCSDPRLPGGHTLTQLESAVISDTLWSSRPSASRSYCKASVSHVNFLVCSYQQERRTGRRGVRTFSAVWHLQDRMLSLAWPWFTFSSEHVCIDFSIGPILAAKSQLLFSDCCQKMDFFPLWQKCEIVAFHFMKTIHFWQY